HERCDARGRRSFIRPRTPLRPAATLRSTRYFGARALPQWLSLLLPVEQVNDTMWKTTAKSACRHRSGMGMVFSLTLRRVRFGVLIQSGANASLDDIAKEAGVGAGTLYRHFPTR